MIVLSDFILAHNYPLTVLCMQAIALVAEAEEVDTGQEFMGCSHTHTHSLTHTHTLTHTYTLTLTLTHTHTHTHTHAHYYMYTELEINNVIKRSETNQLLQVGI